MPARLRLAELAAKERRRVVGLMSGTSADGIDAVLVDLWGSGESTRYEILSFETTPLPSALRREVFALFAEDASLDALCRINFALGEAFATAALAAVERAKLGPETIDLIGSHGQTVRHLPASGATLQIGEPARYCRAHGCGDHCGLSRGRHWPSAARAHRWYP